MGFVSAIGHDLEFGKYRDLDYYGYDMESYAVRIITGKHIFASVWGMLAYRL